MIFAVFLIDGVFEGDERDEGGVSAHGKYRLEFTPEDAEQLIFWHYHANGKNAGRQGELAREFLDYYCALRKLRPNKLPERTGALTE